MPIIHWREEIHEELIKLSLLSCSIIPEEFYARIKRENRVIMHTFETHIGKKNIRDKYILLTKNIIENDILMNLLTGIKATFNVNVAHASFIDTSKKRDKQFYILKIDKDGLLWQYNLLADETPYSSAFEKPLEQLTKDKFDLDIVNTILLNKILDMTDFINKENFHPVCSIFYVTYTITHAYIIVHHSKAYNDVLLKITLEYEKNIPCFLMINASTLKEFINNEYETQTGVKKFK